MFNATGSSLMLKAASHTLAFTVLLAAPATAQRVVDLPAKDKTLAGAPQTVFTVGKEEGDSYDVFSIVQSVAFDAAGNLHVLDRDNARVVVFGPDGKALRAIGKKGEGPGEMQLPMSMAVLRDGRLAVMDVGNGAVSIFGADGAYQSLVRREGGGGMMMVGPSGGGMAAHASGGLVMTGSQLVGGGPQAGPPVIRDSLPILLIPLEGESKVLFQAPSPAPIVQARGGAGRQEVRVSGPPTFSPRVNWASLPDGRLAVTWGLDYRVNIVAAAGGSVATALERPIRPRKVTEKDKDAARQRQKDALTSGAGMMMVQNVNGRRTVSAGGQGLPADQVERMLAQMTFAELMPVIREIRTDPDSRIWVQRDAGSGSADYPIDILAANGAYIGTVKGMPMPNAIGPNGLLAFIETDDLGVQRVSVKRAPAAWFR